MPIKPENKALYPADWKQISARIRERAENRCEFCGILNGIIIIRTAKTWRQICGQEWDMIHAKIRHSSHNMTTALKSLGFTRIVLTVAHLDHNPANCADDNLRALCQCCHLTYDADHHAQTARMSRRCKQTLELFA